MFDVQRLWEQRDVAMFSAGFAYLFNDVKILFAFIAVVVVADLISAWNVLSVTALKSKGIKGGSFWYGLWLSWNDGTFTGDAMTNKFIPKCWKYLKILIAVAITMRVFHEFWAVDIQYIAQGIISLIITGELKSIARNLKIAESPMYEYIGSSIDNHYERKYGQPPAIETDQSTNKDIIQVEEGKQP